MSVKIAGLMTLKIDNQHHPRRLRPAGRDAAGGQLHTPGNRRLGKQWRREHVGALEASFAVFTPVTVSTENVAANHDGTANFTFDLRFSEHVALSYVTLRDHAFEVTNGNVRGARRLAAPSNIQWRITVDPSANAAVRIQLGTTTDCDADGAVCTYDGRKLSGGLDFTVTKRP